jgi:maleylpyruvate isomerase
MRLFSTWRSSCSWRVRIVLSLKQIPHEYVGVVLVGEEGERHRALLQEKSPLVQVPVLELNEQGRTIILTQSLAIIEYLERLWPDPALLPADAVRCARVRELSELVNSGIQPLQNIAAMRQLQAMAPGADTRVWARHFIASGLSALESRARQTAGRYLVGDALSMADVCLVPQLYNARRFSVALEPFPTLLRVEAACNVLEAFQVSHPERQPDAIAGAPLAI